MYKSLTTLCTGRVAFFTNQDSRLHARPSAGTCHLYPQHSQSVRWGENELQRRPRPRKVFLPFQSSFGKVRKPPRQRQCSHLDGRGGVEGEADALDVAQEHAVVLDLHVVREHVSAHDALNVYFLHHHDADRAHNEGARMGGHRWRTSTVGYQIAREWQTKAVVGLRTWCCRMRSIRRCP